MVKTNVMEEGDVCSCEEDTKELKRNKTLESLLYEKKWWEIWK